MQLQAPMTDLFNRSKLMILDFYQIPADIPAIQNIQTFFEECTAKGINPRLPENRQKFNNNMLDSAGMRYLVSRYGEDRSAMLTGSSIAKEGRTLHMGIDIFCKDQETIYAPCDGVIVRASRERQDHSYGYYATIQPDENPGVYIFLGHLSQDLPVPGPVKEGEVIARIGDYRDNENGGWSRHLHLQIITELPPAGQAPLGYSSVADFAANSQKYPDPTQFFPNWHIQ
ncbi:MAG: peptidoglycan DD-metalloendopeptidase family protein [Candidatus Saccharimonadales bacterium]